MFVLDYESRNSSRTRNILLYSYLESSNYASDLALFVIITYAAPFSYRRSAAHK
jgi:hypothetical protein